MNVSRTTEACTGCAMCEALCPFEAIQMDADSQGFWYPAVDPGKCTDCGLCAKRCPVMAPVQRSKRTEVLAGYAKEAALLSSSSSGAAFPVFASEILRRGGIVIGAAFDEEFNVIHTVVDSESELAALCGSKYVQSRISKMCYELVRKALGDNRWVYFSGMPCQIAALKSFLGKDEEKLITQDTACHSVPSPMVWQEYLSELKTGKRENIRSFSFRNKDNGWERYRICTEFFDGEVLSRPAAEDPYQKGFIKGLYSRQSCFSCLFKGVERCSDITLADFWGAKGLQPEAYNEQGTSLILLHSEKGRALLEQCEGRLRLWPAVKDAFRFNPAVLKSVQKPERYEEFWTDYKRAPFEQLVEDCCRQTEKEQAIEKRGKSLLARVIRRLKR